MDRAIIFIFSLGRACAAYRILPGELDLSRPGLLLIVFYSGNVKWLPGSFESGPCAWKLIIKLDQICNYFGQVRPVKEPQGFDRAIVYLFTKNRSRMLRLFVEDKSVRSFYG